MRIILILIFLIVSTVDSKFLEASPSCWIDILIKKLKQDSRLYQVTLFTNRPVYYTDEENAVMKKMAALFPAVTIDVEKLKTDFENRSLMMPVFKDPRESTTYIIWISEMEITSEIEELQKLFERFTQITRKNMRPKCLIINHKKMRTSENWSTIFLEWAWSQKFLDVSIINVNASLDNEGITISSYNPFKTTHYQVTFTEDSELFPDKLIDTNKHLFKIPSLLIPPYIECKYVSENFSSCSGFAYDIIQLVTSRMNMEIFIDNQNITDSILDKIMVNMMKGNIAMMSFIASTGTFNRQFKNLVNSRTLYIDQISCIVPQASTKEIYSFKFDNLIVLMMTIILVVVVINLINRSKLLNIKFNAFEIVKILFFQATRSPVNFAEKVVYFTTLGLSIAYFSDYFVNLINIQISNDNKVLETYKDVYETDLTPYANQYVRNGAFDDRNEYDRKVKSKIVLQLVVEDCVLSIIMGKKNLCFMIGTRANYFVQKRFKNQAELKLFNLKVHSTAESFLFEEASPYLEKFNKIMQNIVEAGLIKELNRNKKNSDYRLQSFDDEQKDGNDFLWIYLSVIFTVGCSLSTIVFIFEILYFSYIGRVKLIN